MSSPPFKSSVSFVAAANVSLVAAAKSQTSLVGNGSPSRPSIEVMVVAAALYSREQNGISLRTHKKNAFFYFRILGLQQWD
jgi:3-methyladenine DNA glycosylase/8-oxoguanine DNA glycosylase